MANLAPTQRSKGTRSKMASMAGTYTDCDRDWWGMVSVFGASIGAGIISSGANLRSRVVLRTRAKRVTVRIVVIPKETYAPPYPPCLSNPFANKSIVDPLLACLLPLFFFPFSLSTFHLFDYSNSSSLVFFFFFLFPLEQLIRLANGSSGKEGGRMVGGWAGRREKKGFISHVCKVYLCCQRGEKRQPRRRDGAEESKLGAGRV